jgi:glycosyltransferase involved in cell wall biosynthesis
VTLRLSVVLPNYNHASLLPRALSALAAQERPADEIVLVDDASTDDSLAVVERFAPRLPGLRAVRLARNGGAAAAIARGLAEVSGNLVYFAAADDVACPRLFARAEAALVAHPGAALAAGEALLRQPDGRVMGLRPAILPAQRERYLPPSEVTALLHRADHFVVSVATVWRRTAIAAAGGFDPGLGSMCDSFLARELALRNGFVFIPEVLGIWHVNPASVSRSAAVEPAAMSAMLARGRRRIEMAVGAPYPSWYPELFERRMRFAAARVLVTEPHGGRMDTDAILAISGGGGLERTALAIASALPAPLQRTIALGWLTLRHRPMSLARLFVAAIDRRWRPRSTEC